MGYIIETESAGYSSLIRIMYGVNEKFEIKRVKILSQGETPGLGTLITKPEFLHQFENKGSEKLEVKRYEDPYTDHQDFIAGLTGATISSRAVTDAIKEGLEALMKEKGVQINKDNTSRGE